MKSLDSLPLGTSARIEKINTTESLKRRLLDLGFIPGSSITPIFCSISGNPTVYLIRGLKIAIRNSDANQILIN